MSKTDDLQRRLDDIKGVVKNLSESIELIEKEIKPKDGLKQEITVGSYWYDINKRLSNIRDRVARVNEISKDSVWALDYDGFSSSLTTSMWLKYYRPATPEEVKEALYTQWEKLGGKEGVMIKGDYFFGATRDFKLQKGEVIYIDEVDTLYIVGGHENGCAAHIYKQGRFAEIIKDEPIKIGGYEVVIHPRAQETTIDGNPFPKAFWQAAKIVAEHSKAAVWVGCGAKTSGNNKWMVDLEIINQILEKLK